MLLLKDFFESAFPLSEFNFDNTIYKEKRL